MPRTNKTRTNRVKTASTASSKRKSKAKKGLATKKGLRLRRQPRRQHKMIVRQESLGQATENRLSLPRQTRPDSRAKVMKAVGSPAFFNNVTKYSIQSPASGTYPAGSTSGLQGVSHTYFAGQAALQKIASLLQGTITPNTSGVSNIQSPARYLLENAKISYSFANRASTSVNLRVYILSAKRDTWFSAVAGASMNYTSPNGTVYEWSGSPVSAFQVGVYAAEGTGAPAAQEWLQPGVLPTESPIFNDYFKIDQQVEIELAQGGTHRMDIDQHFDKVLDASIYANSMYYGIKDVTRFVMFCATGVPVVNTVDANMTTAPVDIGVIETIEYRYTQTSSPAVILNIAANNLQVTDQANLYQINPGSGAQTQVLTA